MGDQGLVVRCLGAGRGDLGADGEKRGLESLDIIGKGLRVGVHAEDGITESAPWGALKCRPAKDFLPHPAAAGRQVCYG